MFSHIAQQHGEINIEIPTCKKLRPGRHLSRARNFVIEPSSLCLTTAENLQWRWAENQYWGFSWLSSSAAGILPRVLFWIWGKTTTVRLLAWIAIASRQSNKMCHPSMSMEISIILQITKFLYEEKWEKDTLIMIDLFMLNIANMRVVR